MMIGIGARFYILAALLLGCTPAPDPAREATSSQAPFPPAGILTGTQRGYMDGDTLTIAGMRVRFDAIAAPERDEPGGAAATAYLRQLVEGREITCYLTGATTRNRGVGACFAGGVDLQAELVRAGVARACPHDSPKPWAARYVAMEPAQAASLPLPAYCKRAP